jgi:hypothetical protein
MYRSARAPHARLIAYDESFALREGDTQVAQREQHVRYGGGASSDPEPGPPELGPYASARGTWLGAPAELATIARLRVAGDLECTTAGRENYAGHDVYHLTFVSRTPVLPDVSDLWVDAQSADVWKLSGYGPVFFTDGAKRIAQFSVDFIYVGPYLLVNHVLWTSGLYTGEYRMRNFAFPLGAAAGKDP